MSENLKLADLLLPDIDKTPDYYEALYPERDLKEGAKVVRVAPSPTGYLHIGTLFTSLVNRITATSSDGIFFTRIEDTDKKREVEGGIENIIDGLNRFGINIDEGFVSGKEEKGVYGPISRAVAPKFIRPTLKNLSGRVLLTPASVLQKNWRKPETFRKKTISVPVITENGQNAEIFPLTK